MSLFRMCGDLECGGGENGRAEDGGGGGGCLIYDIAWSELLSNPQQTKNQNK